MSHHLQHNHHNISFSVCNFIGFYLTLVNGCISISRFGYNAIKKQWQDVYENQLNLVDRGLTESMWKAPGV
jgi:hypothetical protein